MCTRTPFNTAAYRRAFREHGRLRGIAWPAKCDFCLTISTCLASLFSFSTVHQVVLPLMTVTCMRRRSCSITRRHLSHCLLSFLCKLGEVNLYEELRQAYNSVRAEDAPDAPPHTEWSMMGFCDHIFCRWVQTCTNSPARPQDTVQPIHV